MIFRAPVGLPPSPPVRAGAPAVVLAGGVGVPARKWARVVAELYDAHGPATDPIAWTVVERPGLGRRGGHRFGDVPDFADETARLVHDLRRCRDAGASPVIVVAHSAAGFLAEAAVRSNPGLVDGVLLLDVSVVEDAGESSRVFESLSHAAGLAIEPLVRWAWPAMQRGELSSLLLENAVFPRWARALGELRAADEAVGGAGVARSARAVGAVTAVTDVVAVPKRQLRTADAAAVVAELPGREAHLRVWRDLSGRDNDGEHDGESGGAASLREVILAPCSHMVMTRRPADVAAQITALISRASRNGAA